MLGTRIQSMREQLNVSYTKPDPKRLDVYKENLLNSDNAKDYLYKRGLIDKTIEYFHLGYDPVKDAILLDIVKNDFEFQRVPYGEMVEVAKALGIKHKEEAQVGIVDWKHLQEWINGEAMETTEEGWVIEDSAGFMFKLKATFYSRWKMLRGLKDAVHKNGFRISDKAFDSESIKFLTWCKNNFTQEELRSKDIIELRNMFMNG